MNHQQPEIPTSAPSYAVPDTAIVSVEHPCIINKIDLAIDTLGQEATIPQLLIPNNNKAIGLRFDPTNPSCRSIISLNVSTSNVLLKITVPKRTGRKRKRGSNDEFVEDPHESLSKKDSAYLLRSLVDNPNETDIEPLGNIPSTHVWRSIPDFAYTIQGSNFLDNVRTQMLSGDYSSIKQWTLPRTYDLTDTEVPPPPVFSTSHIPFNYSYRQNPAIKTIVDPVSNTTTIRNTQAPVRLHTIQCQHDTPEYPTVPSSTCIPLSNQSESVQEAHRHVMELFENRPMWTRRALINCLPDDSMIYAARQAVAYVAYAIRSGPWRDTMCKLGIDPRKEAKYRKYQTIMLQLVPKDSREVDLEEKREEFARRWNRSQDKTSHIFTGQQRVATDGKVWQLCDLEDAHLKSLVDIPDILVRSTCEDRYFGWYPNGVMAKLKVGLRIKVDALARGESLSDDDLKQFMGLPDELDPSFIDHNFGYMANNSSSRELDWASAYRSICRAPLGTIPVWGGAGYGRQNKRKLETRPSFVEVDNNENEELEDESSPDAVEEDIDDIVEEADTAASGDEEAVNNGTREDENGDE